VRAEAQHNVLRPPPSTCPQLLAPLPATAGPARNCWRQQMLAASNQAA